LILSEIPKNCLALHIGETDAPHISWGCTG